MATSPSNSTPNAAPALAPGKNWTAQRFTVSAALAACGVAATLPAWQDIVHIAIRDEEASHIWLVPIVFAWLVWVRRRRLRQCQPTHTWIGPALIAFGWAVHSFGDAFLYESLWHGGAVLVMIGCALSVLGIQIVRAYLPALIILGFLVPVPGLIRQQIALPLQNATAVVTEHTLMVLGMPVTRSGNSLSINGAEVAIAEACNGLRMVFALALVSYAFAFGTPLRPSVRALVIGLSPVSAVLCNVVRLIPTVWLYGYASDSLADLFHTWAGWVMVVISLLLLMGMLHALRWAMVPVTRYSW